MALDISKTDAKLGLEVRDFLIEVGVETPTIEKNLLKSEASKRSKITRNIASIMTTLGLDLDDPSLQDTPTRVAKMFVDEVFWGLNYKNFPKITTVPADPERDHGIVQVRNITVKSHCEHHLVPIIGRAHIAYIPRDRIIGLSKENRLVEFFSRRPQIQERLTDQIFYALCHVLGTDDVAVMIEADHMCVSMRGVEDEQSDTVTSRLGGAFSQPTQRAEFFSLIKGSRG